MELESKNHPERNVFEESLKGFQSNLPFLAKDFVRGMLNELSALKSQAESSRSRIFKASNLWDGFWKPLESNSSVSTWFASRCSVISVSTADVERVISVFTDVVGDDQAKMIEETIEASVMLRSNNRTPKKRQQRRFCDDGEVISDAEGDQGEDYSYS